MQPLLILLLVIVAFGLLTVGFLIWAWRRTGDDSKWLVNSIWHLPLRGKLRLAGALLRDRRIPLLMRLLPPALVLYLAMPLDLIPDFIPLLGQLDDVLVVAIGAALLLRFTPRSVIEEKLAEVRAG